jgi:hypothetical protein
MKRRVSKVDVSRLVDLYAFGRVDLRVDRLASISTVASDSCSSNRSDETSASCNLHDLVAVFIGNVQVSRCVHGYARWASQFRSSSEDAILSRACSFSGGARDCAKNSDVAIEVIEQNAISATTNTMKSTRNILLLKKLLWRTLSNK